MFAEVDLIPHLQPLLRSFKIARMQRIVVIHSNRRADAGYATGSSTPGLIGSACSSIVSGTVPGGTS